MYQEATTLCLPASSMAAYPYGLYLRATLQPPAPDSLPTHNPKPRTHMNAEPPLGQVVVTACCNSQMTTQ